jgi:hypothetical protein
MRSSRRAALLGLGTALLVAAPLVPAHAAEREARVVVAVRPGAAARTAAYLTRHGFTVTGNDGRTLAATGPASTAARLRGAVDGVEHVAGLGRQHAWRRHAVPVGLGAPALRSAYDIARPGSDGSGLTVATIQFSGWDPADLAAYAAGAGYAAPSVTEITVGGGNPRDTSSGGDVEVALDQEVLLAAAPKAAQRIYFGANSTADAVLVYSRVASDAEAGLVDVVSTSWGMCEPFLDEDAASRAAIETQLARIVAAGATVFAASGDMGAYDCSSPDFPDATVAVDFPAASASVVAVGGTRLTGSTGAWTETAWNDPASDGAFKGYATGGGESSSVARPAWQQGLGLPGTRRLVPDIAAVAAPSTGVGIYAASAGGWVVAGGTSASAPLVAGHLAATLASGDRTTGVGDLHDEIYASPHAFRDVTSGGNLLHAAGPGYDLATGMGTPRWSAFGSVLFGDPVVTAPAATRTTTVPVTVTPVPGMTVTSWTTGEGRSVTCDPNGSPDVPTSVTLGTGNDRATHVAVGALADDGTCHVGIAPVLVDTRRPVAFGSFRFLTGADSRTVFSWGATDPAPSSGVAKYDVCVYAMGSGCVWTRTGTVARTVTLTLSQGRTYVLRVTAVDRAGNRGARVSVHKHVVPLDSSRFLLSGGWSTNGARSSWYGSHLYTTRAGASARKMLAGTRYEVSYVAHPTGGVMDVYVSGVLVKRVNTYASVRQYRKVSLVYSGARRSRAVKVVARRGGVAFDAVRVAY